MFNQIASSDPMAGVTDQSLLSDRAIVRHMQIGNVIIRPFVRENLATSSYDVTLGKFYYRETRAEPGVLGIYNPYSEAMVKKVWGTPNEAEKAKAWTARTGIALENIDGDEEIIWLAPGETILGHTNEFIGGRNVVTTMMKARSSMGRNFIEVCKCAGWGDVGYINRWTMEITNNSQHYSIPLVVGRRIAQIVFFHCEPVLGPSYDHDGKYQSSPDLSLLEKLWGPEAMLPKMYRDREVREAAAKRANAASAPPEKP